ncbi:hypothetical protein NON00_23335 [Roseomonas sp. GC11]|uniref:hypothetical protein n=1 Tax=Roseomonas sp. GC11 TaxID=2950546 RepID=UPI002109FFB4|nr:hypothetical protein [Roseomonas sp. GC11]MCQ4162839.1 hypothetical protein [Roseomonas sp. GC11]
MPARPASSRAIRRKLLSEQRDNCLPVVTGDATVPAVLCLVLTRFAGPGERVTAGFPGAVWGEEGATTVVHLHLLAESYTLLSLAGPAAARLSQGEGVTVDVVVFRQGRAGARRCSCSSSHDHAAALRGGVVIFVSLCHQYC